MTAAYALAGELQKARGRHDEAFEAYESAAPPVIEVKQKGAERFSTAFAPRTEWGAQIAQPVVNAFALPGVARFVIGRELVGYAGASRLLLASADRERGIDCYAWSCLSLRFETIDKPLAQRPVQ